MPHYKSGRITTGVQHGIDTDLATSQDVEKAKPRSKEGHTTFKARKLPLNVSGPRGETIEFDGGYYTTKSKAIIDFLKNEFEDYCDVC